MTKSISRRQSIKLGLTGALAAPLFEFNTLIPQRKSLNILILGGTSFLGPHQIEYALSRGHKVTTFTRGKTQPTVHQSLFNQVTSLIGDRENDLNALKSGQWDVVIDNSGRKVEWTKKTAELLKDKVELYIYTSSTGVYYPYLTNDIKESNAVLLTEPENPKEEEKLEYWYGVMKANSELAAISAFGEDRTIVVRPTYMSGPADKTNRFIHWPLRLSRGGDVLVPGNEDDPVQYIDVRDVAAFMIHLAENKTIGTFNAVGPNHPQTMRTFVRLAGRTFDAKHNFVYIDDYSFLRDNGIDYLVPWIPTDGNNYGSARVNNEKAKKAGLRWRSLKSTVMDTYSWWYSDNLTNEQRAAYEEQPDIVLNREAEIINAWREKSK
ncbi:MAG: NAD-dependent epimerase/dehydratase family protein [Saprospiraceae bacterium]|nr:NAD-dependent epimerase/dehydratase family protein [Saprospiraceae bacterium]